MDKLVIVINGIGGVGKDTLCDIIIKNYKARKISSITPIVKIAKENGWDGIKNSKSRKFLSDLKELFTEFNDLPNNYLSGELKDFLESDDNILFVHIREGVEIKKFIDSAHTLARVITLLVTKKSDETPTAWGNASDDCVEDYDYDYVYHNDLSLDEMPQDFLKFFDGIIASEGKSDYIKPRT